MAVISTKKEEDNKISLKATENMDVLGISLVVILIIITVVTYPESTSWNTHVQVQHVWYYGWITAISTGFGALPFFFFTEPRKFWIGVSNGDKLNYCCFWILLF